MKAENKSSLDAVNSCHSASTKINKVYFLCPSDFIYENGVIVRRKRKYGKFKRIIHVIDYNNRQPEQS